MLLPDNGRLAELSTAGALAFDSIRLLHVIGHCWVQVLVYLGYVCTV